MLIPTVPGLGRKLRSRRRLRGTGGEGAFFPNNWTRDPLVWVCFLLGLLAFARVVLIGELGGSDFLIFALAPFYMRKSLLFYRNKQAGAVLLWSMLLFAGLIIADIYRNSTPEDYLRGWARTSILIITLAVLPSVFEGKTYRFGAYIFGYWLGTVSQVWVGAVVDPYKFYLGIPIAGCCFMLIGGIRHRVGRQVLLLSLGLGGFSFLLNARSVAGMTMLATIILFLNWNIPKAVSSSPKRMLSRSVTIAVAIVASGLAIVSFYQWGASSGNFGAEAQAKYVMQNKEDGGNPTVLDTILGGRQEARFQLPKLMESPIIGYGSWAKDTNYIRDIAAQLHARLGKQRIAEGSIPGHSHILEGWLEAGIAGAVFWGMIFIRAFQCVLTGRYEMAGNWGPVFAFALTEFLWSILFSPFGGVARIHETVMIILVLFLLPRKSTVAASKNVPIAKPRAPLAIDSSGIPAQ